MLRRKTTDTIVENGKTQALKWKLSTVSSIVYLTFLMRSVIFMNLNTYSEIVEELYNLVGQYFPVA